MAAQALPAQINAVVGKPRGRSLHAGTVAVQRLQATELSPLEISLSGGRRKETATVRPTLERPTMANRPTTTNQRACTAAWSPSRALAPHMMATA